MTEINPLKDILRLRDLKNPYMLVGVLGAIATSCNTGSLTARAIDKLVNKSLHQYITSQNEYVHNESLWHGTGRYRYKDGKRIDVLNSISSTGYILPSIDRFDITRDMVSISLAKSRMYARAYADMHGCGSTETKRYGSSLFWACSFLGSVAVEASREIEVWTPDGYSKMMNHLSNADVPEWYKSITAANNQSVITVYDAGSDIPDNYPVLFSIRDINRANTSRAVALHEVRTEEPLDITRSVNHIEVPYDRIDETRDMFKGIKIMSIEEQEMYASQYSYTQHMHGVI